MFYQDCIDNPQEKSIQVFTEVPKYSIENFKWATIQYNTGKDYAIELKVPKHWDAEVSQQALSERDNLLFAQGAVSHPDIHASVQVRYYHNSESFENWISKHKLEYELPQWAGTQFIEEDIVYNNVKYKKFSPEGRNYGFFFIPKNDGVYQIEFGVGGWSDFTNVEISQEAFPSSYEIVPRVLGSLRFVPASVGNNDDSEW
jgi:hypothetical protein